MTTLEAIKFSASVTIGTRIKANGMILVVKEISNDAFIGVAEYKGKERKDSMSLSFATLLNPHYCKDIQILS